MAVERHYTFSIVTYASYEDFYPLLKEAKQWAYITHDKDKSDTHSHIICTFHQPKTFTGVKKLVISEQNTFVQDLKSTVDDILTYFTHEKETDKSLYNETDIIYSDEIYWNERRYQDMRNTDSAKESFIEDLLNPNIDLRYMAKTYGRDFIRYHKQYLDFRSLILNK